MELKSVGDLLLAKNDESVKLVIELTRQNPVVYEAVKREVEPLLKNGFITDFSPSTLEEFFFSDKVIANKFTGSDGLPELIGCMRRLVHLNLMDWPIKTLPSTFNRLSLDTFILMGGMLQKVPIELKQMGSLTHVNLAYNEIDDFPDWLGDLPYLNHLILSKNKITDLPEYLPNKYAELLTLDLSHNPIKELPTSWLRSQKLVDLNLSHTQIESVDMTSVGSIGVFTLDLRGTKAGYDYTALKQATVDHRWLTIYTNDPYSKNANPLKIENGKARFVEDENKKENDS